MNAICNNGVCSCLFAIPTMAVKGCKDLASKVYETVENVFSSIRQSPIKATFSFGVIIVGLVIMNSIVTPNLGVLAFTIGVVQGVFLAMINQERN